MDLTNENITINATTLKTNSVNTVYQLTMESKSILPSAGINNCCYYYYYFYSYNDSGFLSHIYIKVNRLFTPVKKFKHKRSMSKQSTITRSKLAKETQRRNLEIDPKPTIRTPEATSLALLCCHHSYPCTYFDKKGCSIFIMVIYIYIVYFCFWMFPLTLRKIP